MGNAILVTGGSGFIGSNFVLEWIRKEGTPVVNLDKLTYAGNLRNLQSLRTDRRHVFVLGDIGDRAIVRQVLELYEPRAVVHFAAETHVDRSILGPEEFVRTNIEGTFRLLDEIKNWWCGLDNGDRESFRFVQVSTDEVYGSLGCAEAPFSEDHSYMPNSPYSASKAGADHLARAYYQTYGLPTVVTNCSNNYGPYQFPEKLIPLVITKALSGERLPIYGDGLNVRDWLYVRDHCAALRAVLQAGKPGRSYNIGGENERSNLEVVCSLCDLLDELRPVRVPRRELIEFVKDRPGHDRRYAIDARRVRDEIGWKPAETCGSGLRKTVEWYLDHEAWISEVKSGAYQQWVALNYEQREVACGA